jgi:hypothetical protein
VKYLDLSFPSVSIFILVHSQKGKDYNSEIDEVVDFAIATDRKS